MGEVWKRRRGGGNVVAIVEDEASGGVSVKINPRGAFIGFGSHVVVVGGLISLKEDINSLTRGNCNVIAFEGLCVAGI